MTLLRTVNKKLICNVQFINVISKFVISKVFIGIVIVSHIVSVMLSVFMLSAIIRKEF